jgi:hypothetical protein
MGPVRLQRKNGYVSLALQDNVERGFSLLIKEAGLYTLKTGCVDLCIRAGEAPFREKREGSAEFSAGLPLVLRNHREGDRVLRGGHTRRFSDILNAAARYGCTGVITAWDAEGPAAFIALGRELIVISRDSAVKGVTSHFQIFEGANV